MEAVEGAGAGARQHTGATWRSPPSAPFHSLAHSTCSALANTVDLTTGPRSHATYQWHDAWPARIPQFSVLPASPVAWGCFVREALAPAILALTDSRPPGAALGLSATQRRTSAAATKSAGILLWAVAIAPSMRRFGGS